MKNAHHLKPFPSARALALAVYSATAFYSFYAVQAVAEPTSAPAQRQAYFGDLHLHTANSFDAFLGGSVIYPADAYRFARGEAIEYGGRKIQRRVPLDFTAVTDHSEYLGALPVAADPRGPFANTRWPEFLKPAPAESFARVLHFHDGFSGKNVREPELLEEGFRKSNWQRQIDYAEQAYQPGKFTTFVGYEWSSMPGEANLHRNVIFRGKKYPEVPFSALDSTRPEDLWRYLDHNRGQGIDSLAIPHNANVSDGLMFDYLDSDGKPISKAYAEARARNERLVEITQLKGNSETRPELSPNDEFANFEIINNLLTLPRKSKIEGSYVREAYGRGLEIQERTGVNPFQYGVTGSSDIHTGLQESSELDVPSYPDGTVQDVKSILADKDSLRGVLISSSGLVGVWAEANNRESIFDALQRREAFGTSGTRLKVRLFAGNYPLGISKQGDWVQQAYAKGAPMGAEIGASKQSPRFIVEALKDPDAANLDRIQIVKISVHEGKRHEQIFDVVWAGERKPAAGTGHIGAIGSTVDLKKATYTNTIGAPHLLGEWVDPQFDAANPAIYYARVLEIPTPRWSTVLAVKAGEPLPAGVPATLQERGWSSPLFYNPPHKNTDQPKKSVAQN
jgi:hypothetical protein